MDKPAHTKLFYSSLILIECLIWGVGNPLTKVGLVSFTPFLSYTIRFTLAFLIFLLVFRKKAFLGVTTKNLPHYMLIGVFSGAAFLFSVLALQYTTAIIAGFLLSLSVLVTPVFSLLLLKQKIDIRLLPALLIVAAGMYFLCGSGGSFVFGLGELFAVLSSAALALALTLSSKYIQDISPAALSTVLTAVAAVMSAVLTLLFEDYRAISGVSPTGWGVILYLSIGCTVVAYLLQNTALRHVSAITVSFAFCSEPIFTAAAA